MKLLTLLFLVFNVVHSAEYEGLLMPAEQVTLSVLSSGVATRLPFKMGSAVNKGDVLIALDPAKDSLNLVLAERELERSGIEKSGEVEKEIALQLKKIAYKEKFVTAPFTGTVVNVMAKNHEYYSAGAKVIEIADLSSLVTEIHITSDELTRLKKSSDLVVFKGEEKVHATLDSYNPIAEPGLEIFLIKIRFKNRHQWAPGTSVKVKFKS